MRRPSLWVALPAVREAMPADALDSLPAEDRKLLHGYLDAKTFVIGAGFAADIDWAEDLGLRRAHLTPQLVLSEAAWVVVNSGFRFEVVKKIWPGLRIAFAEFIPEQVTAACVPAASHHLNHLPKLKAIVDIAAEVRCDCPGIIADADDPPKLQRLPFIGKVTCYHLAKLLGADVVKPDVHLTRAAAAAGRDPKSLCEMLGSLVGDRATTVDSVLWRWGQQKRAKAEDWERLFHLP
jgi:hypothetical protein